MGGGQPPAQVVGDIEVWRAAMGVGPDDRRPTGPVQRHKAARRWQRRLDEAVACSFAPAWREWRPLVEQLASWQGLPWVASRLYLVRSLLGAGPGGSALHQPIADWSLGG